MTSLTGLLALIRGVCGPELEAHLGPLSSLDGKVCDALGLIELDELALALCGTGLGRPKAPRCPLFHALLAKAIYLLPTTEALVAALRAQPRLRLLCGWATAREVPSSTTFSRAFAEFALGQWPQRLHAALIEAPASQKFAGHVSRDATAISVPERPVKKALKKEGPRPEPIKRLDFQPNRTLAENLADLPRACNVGAKRNSQGYRSTWTGYKLHLDVIDGDLPVSALLTSASLHDSQVAIPLAQLTATRVHNL